ncbi:hypothetical protein [Lactiplantibacillus fabifermentans]|nr:hypothetical protein [Lactiplantibacillus fabifermentans]ETY73339.1 hypothetical protein LFAB_12915 [Lactiplantibacillus fabifermentans T30PCM01]
MKPFINDEIIFRLFLITGCWLIVQLLLLATLGPTSDTSLKLSTYTLIALMFGVFSIDSYRCWRHRLNRNFVGVDALLLLIVILLLFL